MSCLKLHVLPDFEADQAIADAQHQHRDDVDHQGYPGDIGFRSPGLDEICPTVINPIPYIPQRKYVDLWDADQQAQQPGEEDRDPVRSPVQRPQRLTDG